MENFGRRGGGGTYTAISGKKGDEVVHEFIKVGVVSGQHCQYFEV